MAEYLHFSDHPGKLRGFQPLAIPVTGDMTGDMTGAS
jgi:hypothetical protein